jgi:hypothetical protein
MNRMKPHQRSPARVQASATQVRNYWRTTIIASAVSNAVLLEWLPYGEHDLLKMQPRITAEPTIGKCRQLLELCCEAEAAGDPRWRIQRRMDAELWNFMTGLAPSTRYPIKPDPVVGATSEMFAPHEDTQWPKANR